jgi:hypothetical protein
MLAKMAMSIAMAYSHIGMIRRISDVPVWKSSGFINMPGMEKHGHVMLDVAAAGQPVMAAPESRHQYFAFQQLRELTLLLLLRI